MPNTEKGYLIVSVTHSKRTYPIANAQIKIYNQNSVLVAATVSDSSGRTDKIALDAPDINLSLAPAEDSSLAAYYYTIKITADGFDDFTVNGVPIYNGITSIQAVDMTYSLAGGNMQETTNLDPNDL